MPQLSQFGQWVQATREATLTGPTDIINEVQQNSYILGKFLNKSSPFKNVRGGRQVTERIKLFNSGTFNSYNPGDQRNPGRINTMRTLAWDWTFFESHQLYTDAEILLNEGASEYERFKSFRYSLRQDAVTDHINGLESLMFAQPRAVMETGAPLAPNQARPSMSIPFYLVEHSAAANVGRPFGGNGGVGAAAAINTVATLDPTVFANWRNQQRYYDATALGDTFNGLIAAMDQMLIGLQYKPVPKAGSAMQFDNAEQVIVATNQDGVNRLQALYRAANDTFINKTDAAYPTVKFNNLEVCYVSQLDSEILETDNRAAPTQYTGPYAAGRPRYFFINTKWMFPVFHSQRFMYERPTVDGGALAPDTEFMFYASWLLMCARSRKRHGIVAPLV